MATSTSDITRAFGTALGVAVLGALVSAGYRRAIDGRLSGVPQEAADTAAPVSPTPRTSPPAQAPPRSRPPP